MGVGSMWWKGRGFWTPAVAPPQPWNARPQHCQPITHKPCCGTTPTWNARPCHCQPPAMPTRCAGPHHHATMPTRRTGPCHHAIPNTVCKMEQQWGQWDGDSRDGGSGDGSDGEALLLTLDCTYFICAIN